MASLSFYSLSKTLTLAPKFPQKTHLHLCRSSLKTSSAASAAISISVTAAAALLLCRFPKPSLASPPPPIEHPQTLTLDEIDVLDDPRSLRSLLDVKIQSNDLTDAVSILDRLVDLEPHDPELPLLRSHLLIQSGDVELAKRSFERIIERDPFCVEAYNGLVMASREAEEGLGPVLDRIEKAIEMCRKGKRRKEEERDFKLLKAEVLVCEGRYEEGIRVYEELAKEEPRDFRPYLCQGIVYMLMMDKDKAEKMFDKYRRLVPRGHKYARYFDENVVAMKVFGEIESRRRQRSKV